MAALQPKAVLETATGTGVVPRALAPLLDRGVRYVAIDLNQPLLDHASRVQSHVQCDATAIEWRQADALSLPFKNKSFDAACCQFGVMFFPDRVDGFAEARRVLRPGGSFVLNVWDRIEENDFADLVMQAAGLCFPEDQAALIARSHRPAALRDAKPPPRARGR